MSVYKCLGKLIEIYLHMENGWKHINHGRECGKWKEKGRRRNGKTLTTTITIDDIRILVVREKTVHTNNESETTMSGFVFFTSGPLWYGICIWQIVNWSRHLFVCLIFISLIRSCRLPSLWTFLWEWKRENKSFKEINFKRCDDMERKREQKRW